MTTKLQSLEGKIATLQWNFKEIMDNIKLINQRLNKVEQKVREDLQK